MKMIFFFVLYYIYYPKRRKKSKIKPCDCASLNIANIEMIVKNDDWILYNKIIIERFIDDIIVDGDIS